MNYWVITNAGKVVRSDKTKPVDAVSDTLPYKVSDDTGADDGITNAFPTREDAYFCRDRIIDYNPTAFLATAKSSSDEPQPPSDHNNTMSKQDYSQEEFSRLTRRKLIENYDVFWDNFKKLKPKDACDVYMKMARYGFAVAPNLKPIDDEAKQRLEAYRREQTAATIADGLPQPAIATDSALETAYPMDNSSTEIPSSEDFDPDDME